MKVKAPQLTFEVRLDFDKIVVLRKLSLKTIGGQVRCRVALMRLDSDNATSNPDMVNCQENFSDPTTQEKRLFVVGLNLTYT
jgi:hypothetical protein